MRICKFTFIILLFFASCEPKEDTTMQAKPEVKNKKIVIYQVMTRLFGNKKNTNKKYGTPKENGVGKFNDITEIALQNIKELGITHIWYTGVIEHAVIADYSEFGIEIDDADVVKGRAGSPYAIKDYYDVNPDLAVNVLDRLLEFKQLIHRTHEAGLQVILDFVPNHVARKYISDAKPKEISDFGSTDDKTISFSSQNNFYYLPGEQFIVPSDYEPIPGSDFITKDSKFNEIPAKATGNDKFVSNPSKDDWFETVKLNYGIDYQNERSKHFNPTPDTWNKMKEILSYWTNMGVDGFRCDMAEMVPVEFWAWVIPQIQELNSEIIFIAEIYNPDEYVNYISQGKFNYLYDKVELYDTLRHIVEGKGSTDHISAIVHEFESKKIDKNMLRFMENHDEQRLASRFFAGDPMKGWPAVALSATITNGPMMIYFGQEVGEPGLGEEGFQGDDGRTTIFDYWGVPEHQKWMNDGKFDGGKLDNEQRSLRSMYKKLLNLCNTYPPLVQGDFVEVHQGNINSDQGYHNPKVYSYIKQFKDKFVLIVCNFSSKETEINLLLPESFTTVDWTKNTELLSSKKYEAMSHTENTLQLRLKKFGVIMITPAVNTKN